MNIKRVVLVLLAAVILAAGYGAYVIRRGFSTAAQPSAVETVMGRTVRNLGIPENARSEQNPLTATPEALQEGLDNFTNHCVFCHGKDGDGHTGIGSNLYPKGRRKNNFTDWV